MAHAAPALIAPRAGPRLPAPWKPGPRAPAERCTPPREPITLVSPVAVRTRSGTVDVESAAEISNSATVWHLHPRCAALKALANPTTPLRSPVRNKLAPPPSSKLHVSSILDTLGLLCRVIIKNCSSVVGVELNGMSGTVQSYDEATKRFIAPNLTHLLMPCSLSS
eukprot:gene3427-3901_t